MADTTVAMLTELAKIMGEVGRAAVAVNRPDMEALAIESREMFRRFAGRWLELAELSRWPR
jgi:hypothetical protein